MRTLKILLPPSAASETRMNTLHWFLPKPDVRAETIVVFDRFVFLFVSNFTTVIEIVLNYVILKFTYMQGACMYIKTVYGYVHINIGKICI